MKYYFFLTKKNSKDDELEDIIENIYAYTCNKKFAKMFSETRDMKKFTEYSLSLDKKEIGELYDRLVGHDIIQIPIYPDEKCKYNKYTNITLTLTKHESIEIKRKTMEKIHLLSWDFDDNKSFILLKNKYIRALSDIKYDRAVNYEFEPLIADKIVSGDYVNTVIELYGYTFKK